MLCRLVIGSSRDQSFGMVESTIGLVGLAKICPEIVLKYRHWIIFSFFVDINYYYIYFNFVNNLKR